MDINVNALNAFTARFVDPASGQTDEDKRTLITDGHVSFSDYVSDKISRWANRSFSQPNATNLALKDVSSQFYQSVSAIFKGQIPQSVKDALGVHDLADGKMRPLSVRCIKRVKQAVENLDSVKLARSSLASLLDDFKNDKRVFKESELDTIASFSEDYAKRVAEYRQRMAGIDKQVEFNRKDDFDEAKENDKDVDKVGAQEKGDQNQLGTLEEAEKHVKTLAPAVQERIGIQRKMLEFFKAPEALVIRTLKDDTGYGAGSVNEFLEKEIWLKVEEKIEKALGELDALKESGKISAEELDYYKGRYDVEDLCNSAYLEITNTFDAPNGIVNDKNNVDEWLKQKLSQSANEITKLAKDIQKPSENKDYSTAFTKINEELMRLLSPGSSLSSEYRLSEEELDAIKLRMCDYRDEVLADNLKEILTGALEGEDVAKFVINGCEKNDDVDAIPGLEDKVVEVLESVRTENANKLLREKAMHEVYVSADLMLTGALNVTNQRAGLGGIVVRKENFPMLFKNLPGLSEETIQSKIDEFAKPQVESSVALKGNEVKHYVRWGRFTREGAMFSDVVTQVAKKIHAYVNEYVEESIVKLNVDDDRQAAMLFSANVVAIRKQRAGEASKQKWSAVDKFFDNVSQPLAMGPSKEYHWLKQGELTLAKGNDPLRKLLANFAENFYVKNGVFPGDQDFLDRIKVVGDRLEKVVLSAFDTLNTRMTIDKNASHMLKLSVYFKEGSKSRATFHNNLREQLMNVYALAMPEIDKYKDEDLQQLAKATFGAVFNGIDKDDLPTPPEKFSAIKDVFTEFDPKKY